ncbi:helix-turn-helix domain-containing protein [Aegicerativicinus sediminis]|uniref:helix-turn-helix domain-containing protein n=1 Tax=Aegicerativicinus sediminis TaxID=2893202 RepID=UPI001E4854A3|nr:AraC family transcriptional regulator [Aegicerativicinus sediminis]
MDNWSQLNIKGMVCNRCIQTIEETLYHIGYAIKSISLGRVVFNDSLSLNDVKLVKASLTQLGFELLEDRNQNLLNEIKSSIQELVAYNSNGEKMEKISTYLSKKLNKNYDSLAEFFGRYEGLTIEKYFINTRIARVKELLVYTQDTLSEIAFRVGFSSPHHLSNQFKNSTGLNPSDFRELHKKNNAVRRNENMQHEIFTSN